MKDKTILTAESVTEGHPDKLCDLIADSILDECLIKDKNARIACEVMATAGKVIIAGEITAKEMPDIPYIACKTIKHIGYDCDYDLEIITHDQSRDIAEAVNSCLGTGSCGPCMSNTDGVMVLGAGDQGIMYGYAISETPELLPLPVLLAHRITRLLTAARRSGTIKDLKPDGKAQVSIEYQHGIPRRVDAVVVSCQHDAHKNIDDLRREVMQYVLEPALRELPIDKRTQVLINPSGRFVLGGFEADTGLTGRKLMVDTYGGLAPHGGGALSGKDGTKADRSGAYMARYIAKQIVAAGIASKCTVSLAYAIGKTEPIAVDVDTHSTGEYDDEIIAEAVKAVFDLRPAAMIQTLNLDQPIFTKATNYGHFTKSDLPWERLDRLNDIADMCDAIEEEFYYRRSESLL